MENETATPAEICVEKTAVSTLSCGLPVIVAVPDKPFPGWMSVIDDVSLAAMPTPISEIERNERAGTRERETKDTVNMSSLSSMESGPISSTIPLNVPEVLAATIRPLASIIAADTSEDGGCTR
jgi:hypothetical protein